ncbi:hypothetical protein LOC100631783 [Anopheles sinensis]|uniref:Uncharacterized protein n=1 Tax=Anopheles sinensis TaxID=74873 RepID=A0A084W4H0_ANOSI|nr:hypothetical protein LOC100631783 [Anopheles sinensis]
MQAEIGKKTRSRPPLQRFLIGKRLCDRGSARLFGGDFLRPSRFTFGGKQCNNLSPGPGTGPGTVELKVTKFAANGGPDRGPMHILRLPGWRFQKIPGNEIPRLWNLHHITLARWRSIAQPRR